MKLKEIVDKTTLKNFCNYNEKKRWYIYCDDDSPFPNIIAHHTKNASGSLQLVELLPIKLTTDDGIAGAYYWSDIEYLIFSYDSLIGFMCQEKDYIYILDTKSVVSSRTTKNILSILGRNSILLQPENITSIRKHFGLKGYLDLLDKEGNRI